jgi:hypothetical protein
VLKVPGLDTPAAFARTGAVPPRLGVDPHDLVIESEPSVRRQIAEFLRLDGRVIDVCGTAPCHAAGWTGP